MNRITEMSIAGRTYPLNFSTKAAKAVSERYGDLGNIGDAFSGKSAAGVMDEVIWLIALLVGQGVAYKRIVDGEEVQGITADELEVVVGVADLPDMKDQLMAAMMAGMNRTIEVEAPKNAETTQSH